MDNKKLLTNNVVIKTEPNVSTPKKVLLPGSTFAHLTSKNVSTTRLASFKPPRDLLLTGSTTSHSSSTYISTNNKTTRRTFMPNINVTRKKGSSETATNDLANISLLKGRDKEKNKKQSVNRKRNANVVQTKGVFSEGLAPGKIKAFGKASSEKVYNERQVLDKPKLNLNQKVCKSEEDTKLKSILKDDFIDDPSQVPDISFIPNCLPMVYNVQKPETSRDLEKTFEMLQVKTEKVSSVNVNNLKIDIPDTKALFDGTKNPKLFLFEFPEVLQQKDDSPEMKKGSKAHQNETDKQSEKLEGLSSLGEGFLGYLRIHENGKAYLAVGSTTIPLCMTRHVTRQEIMSTGLDPETLKGEVISLGTVDSSFTCSSNFFQDVS